MLSALVNYCCPGSIPGYNTLDESNSFANVRDAMDIAEKQLHIPPIADISDFTAPKPDECSVLLYLSYFIPCGQKVLLSWIRTEIPDSILDDFSRDWTDGKLLGSLLNALSGGKLPMNGQVNLEKCMLSAEDVLGIQRIVRIEEFASTTLNGLARLSYLSQFYLVKKEGNVSVLIPPAAEKVDVGPLQIPRNVGEGESVLLELDSKDAGYGSLHAEVNGEEMGNVDVIFKAEDDESTRHSVLFVPPKIDIYTLSVLYSGEHVNGSPFLINLFSPDPEKVKHVETLLPKEERKDCSLTFDTADAGEGKLKADANGDIGGSVPVKIELKPNGTYILSFVPPLPDIYTIDVLWGKFSAVAKGEFIGPIPVEMNQNDQKECVVSFKPPSDDIYTLDVQWDGEPVPGSPFVIDLLPPADPTAVLCSLPIYTEPGETVELLVDVSSAGSGELEAKCSGDEVGEVPVEISNLGERAYQVTFTPTQQDLYSLNVSYDNKDVDGSPFTIDMQPGAELETGEIENHMVPLDFINEICDLELQSENVFTMPDFPLTTDEHPVEETLAVQAFEENIYDIPEYFESIDEEIEEVAPQDDMVFSEFSQIVGKSLNVKIRPESEEDRNGTVVATVIGENVGPAIVTITKLPDDTTIVKFRPMIPDLYTVVVKLNDVDVPNTPFKVKCILPQTDPSKCNIIGIEDIPELLEVGEEINLLINATDAGPGELSVTADKPTEDNNCSILNTRLRCGEKDVYEVDYTPNSRGHHQLSIKWFNELIPRSPIDILAVNTKEAELFPHGKPVGVEFKVDAKQSDLRVKIVNKDMGTLLKGKLSKIQKGQFKAYFSPINPGLYFIYISAKGIDIPSSPLVIKYGFPINPQLCKVHDLKPTCFVEEEIKFVVDCKEAGNGDIQVKILGSSGKKERANVNDNKDGTYNISLTPNFVGDYWINILWSGKPIPSSPLPLTVKSLAKDQPITKLHLVDCVGTIEAIEFPSKGEHISTSTNHSLNLTVKPRTKQQKNGKLIAVATKTETGETIVLKSLKENDTFDISFIPPSPGHYTISAKVGEEQVPNTPILVECTSPPPIASNCKLIGLDEILSSSSRVGKNISFQIDSRLAGNGEIDISAESPRGKPNLEAKPSAGDKRIVNISYIPNVPGTHKLKVSWSGVELPQSPIAIEVEPIPIYPNGKPIAFSLDLEAHESDLNCLVFHEESGIRLKSKLNKIRKNRFNFSFKPRVPGLYSLLVYVKSKEIDNSPFYIRYASSSKPEAVVLCDVPEEAYVSEPLSFLVDTTNAGLSQLKVKVTPPKKGKEGDLGVKNNNDGTYTVQYVPKSIGTYSFALTWEKKRIPKSPLKIKVHKENSAHGSVASLESKVTAPLRREDTIDVMRSGNVEGVPEVGTSGPSVLSVPQDPIPLGDTVDIDIDIENCKHGSLKVNQSGEGQCDLKLKRKENGQYACGVTPFTAGSCVVNILLNDENIKDSPVSLDFCGVAGLSLQGKTLQVGTMHKFTVRCDKIQPGPLHVYCNDNDKNAADIIILPSENSYLCTILPKQVGYHTISVKYHGYDVIGSPFDVEFIPPSATNMSLSLTSLAGIESSNMSASMETSTDFRQVPVLLKQLLGGQYSLDFVPTKESEYLLTIKCLVKIKQEVELSNGIFDLSYTTQTIYATECTVEGEGTVKGEVGSWSSFVVQAEDNETGELSVTFDDSHLVSSEPIITPLIPSIKYEVKYLVKKRGNFKISINWNDKPIPGSPFEVTCNLPEKIPVDYLSEFPSTIEHGKSLKFSFKLKDCFTNGNIEVTAHSESIGMIMGSHQITDEGSFNCAVQLRHPGRYIVDVTWENHPIDGTPFEVNIIQPPKPENVKVHGPGLQGGTVGEGQTFIIETQDAGSGDVAVYVSGPEGEFEVNLGKDPTVEPKALTASYTPQVVGTYSISVLWNGEHVLNSPFAVLIE